MQRRSVQTELFGERDDDAIGAADVAEPIEILVLPHLADELGAVSPHAGNDVVDVVDGEHALESARALP